MDKPLKIIVPMAGWGTRMRPHTWSKPKPLISVAGKTALDHLMDTFHTLPQQTSVEYVFIVSPCLGETQIPVFMNQHYPHFKVHYVVQSDMKGQSHALWLAGEYLSGPLLIIYSDTLIETDFSSLETEPCDGVAWVKPVEDPRRFGVAELDEAGRIARLIEKPQGMENNLALVGCYFLHDGQILMKAIEEQMRRKIQLKGEYFLVDAMNILLERGSLLRVEKVDTWLDTGTIEATLATNRYLLEHGRVISQAVRLERVKIIEPVFIHRTAEVRDSEIGPNVSIGAKCVVTNSRMENSILEEEARVVGVSLKNSLIGRQTCIHGKGPVDPVMQLNIGDNSSVVY